MTADELRTRIAELEAVRHARLTGSQLVQVGRGDRVGRFAEVSMADINAEIARLRIALAKLTGEASGVGPIVPGFGSRP